MYPADKDIRLQTGNVLVNATSLKLRALSFDWLFSFVFSPSPRRIKIIPNGIFKTLLIFSIFNKIYTNPLKSVEEPMIKLTTASKNMYCFTYLSGVVMLMLIRFSGSIPKRVNNCDRKVSVSFVVL